MKKIKYFFPIIAGFIILINSCELDNYNEPNASLTGSIIDSETGELIESDIINGITIKIIEHGYDPVTPQYLKVKNDGTYANTMLFANTYTIQPDLRNFIQIDAQDIAIKKNTKLDFQVTPYIRVKVISIEQEGNNIIATLRLQQMTKDPISKIGLYVYNEPIVGEAARSVAVEKVLNRQVDEDEIFKLGINAAKNSAFLTSGNQYFFRVGAVSSFAGAKFNYAPAKRITLGEIDPNEQPAGKALDLCESIDGWASAGVISLDADHKEGSSSVKTVLSGNASPVFEKTFTPFDSEVSIENGYLSFWLYLSDASILSTSIPDWGSSIEITSAGLADSQELHWDFSMLRLNNGWNKIDLKLSDAVNDNRGGDINLSAINYFRIYHLFCGGEVEVKIDDIRFYEEY